MCGRDGCRLDRVGANVMRMRRCQSMELARYYKRLENIEKRKEENERHTKNSFMVRMLRRLGLVRGDNNRRL